VRVKNRVILDLCAGSGAWSQPYKDAGYTVIRVDLPTDVRLMRAPDVPIHGVLAAPPCTVFSYARNRYQPTDVEILAGLSVVDACLRVIAACRPLWWALENPVNKLRCYLGRPAFIFRQWEFGDPGHKPTALWGEFKAPAFAPARSTKPSTWGTKMENASPEDAITPPGFARAFLEANP
jgi:hypothetical protein